MNATRQAIYAEVDAAHDTYKALELQFNMTKAQMASLAEKRNTAYNAFVAARNKLGW